MHDVERIEYSISSLVFTYYLVRVIHRRMVVLCFIRYLGCISNIVERTDNLPATLRVNIRRKGLPGQLSGLSDVQKFNYILPEPSNLNRY